MQEPFILSIVYDCDDFQDFELESKEMSAAIEEANKIISEKIAAREQFPDEGCYIGTESQGDILIATDCEEVDGMVIPEWEESINDAFGRIIAIES